MAEPEAVFFNSEFSELHGGAKLLVPGLAPDHPRRKTTWGVVASSKCFLGDLKLREPQILRFRSRRAHQNSLKILQGLERSQALKSTHCLCRASMFGPSTLVRQFITPITLLQGLQRLWFSCVPACMCTYHYHHHLKRK